MALYNSRSSKTTSVRAECECLEENSCSVCSATGGHDIFQQLSVALKTLEHINSQLNSVKGCLNSQESRLKKLEITGNEGSDEKSKSRKRKHRKMPKNVSSKNKSHSVLSERENERQSLRHDLRVQEMQDYSSHSDESVSEDLLGLKHYNRKSSKQTVTSVPKSRSNAKKTEKIVYEDSDSAGRTSGNSDTDTEGRRRQRRRKVKSGSKVKHRPVVKTEVWPHTIQNEEDGKEVTSEDISLSKFLTCFTHLMITCAGSEAIGRSVLLHAISTVLECLPWVEARLFHNIMMLKIEQGRLNWGSNFTAMADQFLEKKVRNSLREKSYKSGTGSSYETSSNRNSGKGFESSRYGYSGSNTGKSNTSISVICRLWNSGFCSFGAECKRWHVCLACAEQGRLGEPHMASTHNGSSANIFSSEQRV